MRRGAVLRTAPPRRTRAMPATHGAHVAVTVSEDDDLTGVLDAPAVRQRDRGRARGAPPHRRDRVAARHRRRPVQVGQRHATATSPATSAAHRRRTCCASSCARAVHRPLRRRRVRGAAAGHGRARRRARSPRRCAAPRGAMQIPLREPVAGARRCTSRFPSASPRRRSTASRSRRCSPPPTARCSRRSARGATRWCSPARLRRVRRSSSFTRFVGRAAEVRVARHGARPERAGRAAGRMSSSARRASASRRCCASCCPRRGCAAR